MDTGGAAGGCTGEAVETHVSQGPLSGPPGAVWGGFDGAPLAAIPPGSLKRVGGRKTGGVSGGVPVKVPLWEVDWAPF